MAIKILLVFTNRGDIDSFSRRFQTYAKQNGHQAGTGLNGDGLIRAVIASSKDDSVIDTGIMVYEDREVMSLNILGEITEREYDRVYFDPKLSVEVRELVKKLEKPQVSIPAWIDEYLAYYKPVQE